MADTMNELFFAYTVFWVCISFWVSRLMKEQRTLAVDIANLRRELLPEKSDSSSPSSGI